MGLWGCFSRPQPLPSPGRPWPLKPSSVLTAAPRLLRQEAQDGRGVASSGVLRGRSLSGAGAQETGSLDEQVSRERRLPRPLRAPSSRIRMGTRTAVRETLSESAGWEDEAQECRTDSSRLRRPPLPCTHVTGASAGARELGKEGRSRGCGPRSCQSSPDTVPSAGRAGPEHPCVAAGMGREQPWGGSGCADGSGHLQ